MNRPLRRLLAALGAVVLGALLVLVGGSPARAASDPIIRDWAQVYTVQPNGDVAVEETMTYDFSVTYGKHGMERGLVVREPYRLDDSLDRTYEIKDLSVTSPTPGVSTAVQPRTVDTTGGEPGRNKSMMIRVGDANRTVGGTVTYVLHYTVVGAIRSDSHGDDLYWDAIPSESPQVDKATVTMKVPGKVVKAQCLVGTKGSATPCEQTEGTNEATFTATALGNGRQMTTAVLYPQDSTPNNQPRLEQSATAAQRARNVGIVGATGLTGLLSAIIGALWWRRNGRDERYLGISPGLMPAPGQPENVGRDDRPTIPVQFNPPPVSPGEGGVLIDGSADTRDMTATLVDLAVRGALRLSSDSQQRRFAAVLVNPDVATLPHEQTLIANIFGGVNVGEEVDLSERGGPLYQAQSDFKSQLSEAARERGWYKTMPNSLGGSASLPGCGGLLLLVALPFLSGFIGPWVWFLVPLAPVVLAFAIISMLRGRGRRSATGRALTDQVEGFRNYIATAEAEQLRFEEGEDIFSKYLPWAIAFNLADRWTKVCARLVELGRIPDTQPSWYYGGWYGYGYFDPGYMNDSASVGSSPVPSTSSGSGSGGGSFGGIDIGGGGGGGSAGSW